MLPNVDKTVYARFKKVGYRKVIFREMPVETVCDIVQLGYLDVNRTITGIGKDPNQSISIKQDVIAFINDLLIKPPNSQPEFDRLHHQCCQQCTNSIGQAHIHYGQAQKLVNMSLKYLYNEFAFYRGEKNQLGFPNNDIEYFFHLPIDNQILSYLVSYCSFKKPTFLPWSKWTYEHYITFQIELRNRIINDYKPLEIDYLLWNEQNQSLENVIRPGRRVGVAPSLFACPAKGSAY